MGTNRKLPFGYKMECGSIVADPVEGRWVHYLFSRYNMGVTLKGLSDNMNDTGVRYDGEKPWNKNMVARILADTRYLGNGSFPPLLEESVFLATAEKRKKKAPMMQNSAAQTILRKKCNRSITPHIEHEVLYLLNCLINHPERIESPRQPAVNAEQLRILEAELEELLTQLPVDEEKAKQLIFRIAVVRYEEIDPNEYETYRMREVFQQEDPKTILDENLVAMNVSAVIVDSKGNVKVRLRNGQVIERGE